jgi:hypothetical protein
VNIQVIDINGRVVYSVKMNFSSELKLNLNDLTSGIYISDGRRFKLYRENYFKLNEGITVNKMLVADVRGF